MKKLYLLTSFVIVLVSVLSVQNLVSDKQQYKIPGAYKALDMFSYTRAYPYSDIPNAAYSLGYEQHLKLKSKGQSIFKSDNHEWEAMGPKNTAGRCLTIATNPQAPNTVYMGTASGGLWRSRNLGLDASWEYMPTGFPVLGVSTIAFADQDSSVMYIGTGEVYNFFSTGTDGAFRSTRGSYGIGILKSEDGGQTWEKSLDWTYQQNHGIWMIKVSAQNPDKVYTATTQGIYLTQDGGKNWERILDVIMATDLEIDPRDDNRVIVSCGNFGTNGKGIYRTVDGGANWEKALAGEWANFQGKILLARAESNPDIVYASVGNGFGFNDGATWLLRSNNNGLNWTVVNTQDYSRWQGWFSHDIAVNPEDPDELMAVGIDVFKGQDGGATLIQKTQGGVSLGTPPVNSPDGPPNYSHSDHHFVMYHPSIEDCVIVGNDGGMFISFDNGESYQSANGNLQTTQFYNGFSVSQSSNEFAMGGLQDNSTVIFRGRNAWQRAIGGDGSWSAINQRDNQTVFGSYQNLNILKSPNNGLDFFNAGIGFEPDEAPLFIAPYVISDSDEPVMYGAGRYVYKSEDLAESWITTNNGSKLNGDPVFCLDVFDTDPDVVYAGTVGLSDQPRMFATADGGLTWQRSNTTFPDRIPNDVAIHPYDPNIAYVVFSGFGTDHLFKTEDGGINWEPIGDGLPDVPANAIAIDPADPTVMYLGNDISVYLSVDSGMNWEVFNETLPDACIVMDLVVQASDRQIWLATHGNGSYRAVMVSSIVSNNDLVVENIDLKFFPNPTSDILNIRSDDSVMVMDWKVYGLDGKCLITGNGSEIDMCALQAGSYLVTVGKGTFQHTERIVKL